MCSYWFLAASSSKFNSFTRHRMLWLIRKDSEEMAETETKQRDAKSITGSDRQYANPHTSTRALREKQVSGPVLFSYGGRSRGAQEKRKARIDWPRLRQSSIQHLSLGGHAPPPRRLGASRWLPEPCDTNVLLTIWEQAKGQDRYLAKVRKTTQNVLLVLLDGWPIRTGHSGRWEMDSKWILPPRSAGASSSVALDSCPQRPCDAHALLISHWHW